MESENKTILVPWDFTEVAKYAADHALNISKITGGNISLLHIVKKEQEVPDVKNKLQAEAEKLSKEYGVPVEPFVRPGSIFNAIGKTSEELDAEIITMGTHGIKGMQKIMGSWALKVIVSSKVPFLVVQAPPESSKLEKIVFPLDFKKENKEKLRWVGYLSNYYKAKVHVIRPLYTDKGFKKGLQSNLIFAQKYLDNNSIDYEITVAEGKKDFPHETIEFAQSIKADVILIMTTKGISLADYVLGANEQYIIANSAKIPVMCVNPRPSKFLGSFSAAGG
jgi:nucleotide-binding universal stress UspA family protein